MTEAGVRTARACAAIVVAGFVLGALLVGASTAPSARAAFPGTNGKILFDRPGPASGQVFAMNADGSDQVNLTNDPAGGYFATGSPDGRKIAFTRCASDCDIVVMNADGSGQTNITNNAAADVRPAWSPDGKKIAFGSLGRGRGWEIFVMNADGSDQENLTNDAALDWEPAWSPDGTKIAFSRITEGTPSSFEVVVMNADGSGQTSLTPAPSQNGISPDWSPDGTKIAYTAGVPFPPESNLQGAQPDVFVMNPDGSGKTNLTNTFSVAESNPVWSPDGTKIAVTAQPMEVGSNTDIVVMNADGSGRTNVTNSSSFELGPDWVVVPQPLPPSPPPPPPPPPTAKTCRVPKLVGLRLAAAKQRIRGADCAVGRIRKKRSTRVGRVLAQSPRAGARLPLGGRVNLVVGRRK